MSAHKTDEKLAEIHAEALREFDEIFSAVSDGREQCLEDRRFATIAGAQWEGPLSEQFENKPKYEVNKTHLALIRIYNEYRNNRITVNFKSKDGSESDRLADACDGLYRADEQDSSASEAYDNAFDEGTSGGIGAWRYRAAYEDELDDENDNQRIIIEPIYDADSSVFFDLNAKRYDKADATRCFVITSLTRDAYEEEFDDTPTSWPNEIKNTEYDWSTPDVVYVAEYYRVETVPHVVRIFRYPDGTEERLTQDDFDADEKLEIMLAADGAEEIGTKKVKKRKVRKYIMSGGAILEDCGYIAGPNIPIVMMYGKRWYIDNIERCMGHVRLVKDVQRLKNMQLSQLAELSALSPIETPIFTHEQMAGNEEMWGDKNIKNYPYMLINSVTDAAGNEIPTPPIGYTKPPQIAPAMAALLQVTEIDIGDLLGNQQAGEKMMSNISGDAIEMIHQRLDMQTYMYMSNMAKSMKRGGEIWLGIARDILIESGRKMKTITADGAVSQIELGRPVLNTETGETEYENDLSRAIFDVVSDVGPSSSTKRNSTVRQLTGMMQVTTDPETINVLSTLAMQNMEGEGLDELKPYWRKKLLKLGAVKPTDEELEEMQAEIESQPPDANAQYLEAAANEANATAANKAADTELKMAKTQETIANTIETLSEVDMKDREAAVAAMRPSQNGEMMNE